MQVTTYFTDFLTNIRPNGGDLKEFSKAHTDLRKWLLEDEKLSPIIVNTFLQGSYKRATAIRPTRGQKGDVDVVVVTTIPQASTTPQQAIDLFMPFVKKHYPKQHEPQGRSIGIELEHVDLDLVVTSAPSESEKSIFRTASFTEDFTLEDAEFVQKITREQPQWKLSKLYIPDRDVSQWVPTHPLRQIEVTKEKNAVCNGHFVNVVKALKWWRRRFGEPEYPKGYPVEHLIWSCCPDAITTVADGVTMTLENIVRQYPTKPYLADHGVPEHDVMKRVTSADYALFYEQVEKAAILARTALDESDTEKSVKMWRELFGDTFPPYGGGTGGNGGGSKSGGFTPRDKLSSVAGGRFA